MRFNRRQSDAYRTFESRWEEVGYENLTEFERQVVALEALEGDVMNGGLSQYFSNSSGDLAAEALIALDNLGAWQTYKALTSAIAKIWADGYPNDRAERFKPLEDAEERDENLLDEETEVIQDLPEDFLALALDKLAVQYQGDES